ncbi:hypothetical protein T10_10765 [Trichinella papuae]|uniref:Uncharacterized protein n=1 Tax=Trichinella papuae TaxID=268474 RepID=A0A0V1N058_9BILA|nr:hypothetical protein T10_10765 [Trichinella papuae]
MDTLAETRWFSTLDIASEYLQVEVAEDGVLDTGWTAPIQGDALRPVIGMTWSSCVVYLDDVVVYRKAEQEHLERLTEVFEDPP